MLAWKIFGEQNHGGGDIFLCMAQNIAEVLWYPL